VRVSCRLAVVELQQIAESAVAPDRPGAGGVGVVLRREEDDVVLALVRTLVMVVLDEVVDGALEGRFAEQDQVIETFLLYAPDEPFGEGVEVGTPRRQAQQFHARRCDDVAKRRRKLSVAVREQYYCLDCIFLGLITRRSEVRILPPLYKRGLGASAKAGFAGSPSLRTSDFHRGETSRHFMPACSQASQFVGGGGRHMRSSRNGKPMRLDADEVRAITEDHAERMIVMNDDDLQVAVTKYAENFRRPAAAQPERYVRRQQHSR
jgi:hypothetical protein